MSFLSRLLGKANRASVFSFFVPQAAPELKAITSPAGMF
jgi:hypothetical protein